MDEKIERREGGRGEDGKKIRQKTRREGVIGHVNMRTEREEEEEEERGAGVSDTHTCTHTHPHTHTHW